MKIRLGLLCAIGAVLTVNAPYDAHSENNYEKLTVVDPDPSSDENGDMRDNLDKADHSLYEHNKALEKKCRPRFSLPGYDDETYKHLGDLDWRIHHPASVIRYHKDCQALRQAAQDGQCDYGEKLCLPADID